MATVHEKRSDTKPIRIVDNRRMWYIRAVIRATEEELQRASNMKLPCRAERGNTYPWIWRTQ